MSLVMQIPEKSRLAEVGELLARYWPVLLPALLGFGAVYLLLPRARPFPRLYAALASILALVAAGMLLINSDTDVVESVLFYVFSGLAVAFGGLMLTQTNPVHAALSFAMVVLSTCGLFLLQAAPFLMAATIIIYAGAIVVTFLFVIMLAQQVGRSSADARSREPFLATVAGFVLLGALLCVLHKSYSGINEFAERAEAAAAVSTVAQWEKILGKDDRFFTDYRRAVLPVLQGRQFDDRHSTGVEKKRLADALDLASTTWNALRAGEDGRPREAAPETIMAFQDELKLLVTLAAPVRQSQGSLRPSSSLPLSKNAGTPANAPPAKDGKAEERLQAANVAGLGRALFIDYLLAVELAGTLLLVATIGAIAIAGRRTEGLR